MAFPPSDMRKHIQPYLRVIAIALLAILISFAGLRILSWNRLGQHRRELTLVNPWNPVSETGYRVRLARVENGLQADRSCATALKDMLQACRAAGRDPLLLSAWRSVDDQLVLYDDEVQRLVNSGLSPDEAEDKTARLIARPGRSEHELGLAFDIVDASYPEEDETQASTLTSQWLAENAWRYGFIQRYPRGADAITGYSWHPWHYRYVGTDVAESIWSLGITLEEYLSLFYSDEAAVVYD